MIKLVKFMPFTRNLILLTLILFCPAAAQNIQTIAGGGPHNLQSLQTGLAQPSGLAVDSSGNVYVSLAQINQIWKITTAGSVSVFAGNGSYPYDTDGIPALSATLNQPEGLAFDTAGNLYVADSGHNRVRKISTGGTITTVAGNGVPGFGGDGGAATLGQLNFPVAVAVDTANNVYIADQTNQRIRMVSSGGTITTLAGNGVAGFAGDGGLAVTASLKTPVGVAVDSTGAVYIADQGNFRVRKVVSGVINTVAGNGTFGIAGDGGPAIAAQLNSVTAVTVDAFNNLYIVETYDVRIVAASQTTISKAAGTSVAGYSGDGGSPAAATFRNLAAMALDSAGTTAYVADAGNSRIRKFSSTLITTFAGNGTLDYNNGSGSGLLGTSASLLTPNTVAVDNAGSLIFADTGGSSIRRLALSSGLLTTAAGSGVVGVTADGGSVAGPAANPYGLTIDGSGNILFVEGSRIRKVAGGVYSTIANTSGTTGFAGDGGPATTAQFRSPGGLALAANGDLYVADSQNHRVRVINGQTGVIVTIAGNGTAASTGDGGVATSAALNFPSGLALDGAGNLYVTEVLGNRVRKIVLSTNIITTVAGNGTTSFQDGVAATATGLSVPFSIFADQSSNLFIADEGHSRVRKVTASTGSISTVAGNGVLDFSGDGGLATLASVDPLGITVDRTQNLYIADSSGRIRSTPVLACFFTVSTPTIYVNSRAGTGSVTVAASDPSCPYVIANNSPFLTITSGASGTGGGTVTFSYNGDTGQNRTATILFGGQSINVVQAGVLGQENVGFFQPTNGPLWVLDANGSGAFDAGDKVFPFAGQAGVTAITGDWNGDGRSKVGYYTNGFWVLDYNGNGTYDGVGPGGDKFYGFGGSGASYVPITGDWNGDGKTKVGFYKDGFWALDTNGNGTFDAGDSFFAFGGNGAGEIPVFGDWNGDGRTKIGYFFQGRWVLDYNGDGAFTAADKFYTNFTYAVGDIPVVGDWTGDGKAKIGIYRGGFWILDYNGNGTYDGVGPGGDKFYGFGGNAGEIPFVGDWNGTGTSKVGIYVNGFWVLDFNGNGSYDGTGPGGDRFIPYGGTAGNQPLIGRW